LGARCVPRPHLEFCRMMILRSSPPSPFGRKVKIAAALLGLDKEITIEKTDTTDASDTIRKQNPLGKIPALILEDGSVLHDSPVILDYLDHRAGGAKIIPSEPKARYAALTLQSLCDGVLDACLLQVYEGRWRPVEKHEKKWVDYQAEKVKRAFDVLEAAPPVLGAIPNVGEITLACALGYGDLRFAGTWRKDCPRLVAWLDAFAAKVPAFEATRVTA
jgi:glutathione S-transferase